MHFVLPEFKDSWRHRKVFNSNAGLQSSFEGFPIHFSM